MTDETSVPAPRPPREPGKRLFVGIPVSVATANALAAAAQTLARRARDGGVDVKWVAPTNYHVTVKFLGWTRESAVAAVRDALDAAARGTPRFSVRTARIGAFPSLERASIVWAGAEETGGGGALAELANKIDAAMAGLGYRPEARAFHPHVTIGRLRENRPLKDVVLPLTEQMFGDTRIDAVTLFESEMKPAGSIYKEISRIEFKPLDPTAERQTRAVDLGTRDKSSESRVEDDDTDDGWPRGQGPNH